MVGRLFAEGVRHFIIPTRQGDTPKVRAQVKYILETPGATMTIVAADMGKKEDLQKVMQIARTARPPLKKIVHAAGVSIDAALPELDMKNFHQVMACKAVAAWHMSELTKDLDLDDFTVISSVASLIGGMGIGSYAGANAFLDGLIRYRRAQGLVGHTFNMG